MDRDDIYWTKTANIGRPGEILDNVGKYWIERRNIGQKRENIEKRRETLVREVK